MNERAWGDGVGGRRVALALALAGLVGACGGTTPADDAAMDAAVDAALPVDAAADRVHMPAYCVSDPRAQSYVVGAHASDGAHAVNIALAGVDPTPPLRDNYVWAIALTDASGAPMSGVAMTVFPWMPDHGHGAMIVPSVTETGGGQYVVHNLDLFMEGIWTVTFRLGVAAPGLDAGVAEAGAGDGGAAEGGAAEGGTDAGDGVSPDAAPAPAADTVVFTVCVGGT